MKIGIITLHRVINFGSALQAYALQHYLEKTFSAEVELIDYIYPNVFHKKNANHSLYKHIKTFFRRILKDNLLEKRFRQIRYFNCFYKKNYKLSRDCYQTIESIEHAKPLYDLYITGSDQVWNVKTLYNDPVCYCSFAPKSSPKISFSASFSVSSLPSVYKDSIRKRLNEYSFIGVREASALEIIKDLEINSDIVVENTCDPTFLLDRQDYDDLAEQSRIQIDGEYILAYKLEYAYKAEPTMTIAMEDAKKKFGCKVVMIDNVKTRLPKGDAHIYGIGPCEFLWLCKNAKAIVTSSFHGTIFSIIYRKHFVSVVPPKSHGDCRIVDLLVKLGLENHILYNESPYTQNKIKWQDISESADIDIMLKRYVDYSKNFIYKALSTTKKDMAK